MLFVCSCCCGFLLVLFSCFAFDLLAHATESWLGGFYCMSSSEFSVFVV